MQMNLQKNLIEKTVSKKVSFFISHHNRVMLNILTKSFSQLPLPFCEVVVSFLPEHWAQTYIFETDQNC